MPGLNWCRMGARNTRSYKRRNHQFPKNYFGESFKMRLLRGISLKIQDKIQPKFRIVESWKRRLLHLDTASSPVRPRCSRAGCASLLTVEAVEVGYDLTVLTVFCHWLDLGPLGVEAELKTEVWAAQIWCSVLVGSTCMLYLRCVLVEPKQQEWENSLKRVYNL